MSKWFVNNMGSHNVYTICMYHYSVLRIGLKTVQWTETCRQVYSVDYWFMLFFDWTNYFIIIQTKRDGSYH